MRSLLLVCDIARRVSNISLHVALCYADTHAPQWYRGFHIAKQAPLDLRMDNSRVCVLWLLSIALTTAGCVRTSLWRLSV